MNLEVGEGGASSDKICFFESGGGLKYDKEKLVVPYCSQIFQLKRGANSKSFFFYFLRNRCKMGPYPNVRNCPNIGVDSDKPWGNFKR